MEKEDCDTYKLKYLKYKAKYIQLKKQTNAKKNIGGNFNEDYLKDYLAMLKNLYPTCVKKPTESSGKTFETYGEMEYVGVEKLCNHIDTDNLEYFIDIGSGRGKLPCWFANLPNIKKSIGIEIVSQRHLDGIELVSNLSKSFPTITEKILLLEGSFEQYNLGELVSHSPNVLVWISNLCFGEELSDMIFAQILEQLERKTIICCSKKPSNIISDYTLNNDISKNDEHTKKIFLREIIQIQMSWWNNLSDVYVCEIV